VNIYDKNNNLLAIVVKSNSSTEEKDFYTDHTSEFQIASFNLKKMKLYSAITTKSKKEQYSQQMK
jgi:hypothetical protein